MHPMRLLALMMALIAAMAVSATNHYDIYPVPQRVEYAARQATFTSPVAIVAASTIDRATVARTQQVLAEHGLAAELTAAMPSSGSYVLLGTDAQADVAVKRLTELNIDRGVLKRNGKYDRHIISLTPSKRGEAQLVVVGENTDAVFCALASLEQMLDAGHTAMPCCTIHDYADVKNRGIIEGYYGVPYSVHVTKDLFRFMARYKMNTYMYGAKSDPYHSRYWDKPYPTHITPEQERIGYLSQDMMRDITATAAAAKVNFIWAIHPGKAFANAHDHTVIDRIMGKFEDMHKLGVRQFGVFVDDVGVPSDTAIMNLCARNLTALQHSIDQRWNVAGAAPDDSVRPLNYVPQLYAYGWVDVEKAKIFYESLQTTPRKVNIFITGQNVWSVPNNNDLDLVSRWLGRSVSWWWNYPCNDQDPTKLFIMDTYANFRDETHIASLATLERQLHGTTTVIVNPMQQGELSKVALFAVADYAWNNRAFNSQVNWEASFAAVTGPKYASALRRVAPYLRYYDEDALEYLIAGYKSSVEGGKPEPRPLINELTAVNRACHELMLIPLDSSSQSNALLYQDMRPWLLRLEAMTAEAIALLQGQAPEPTDYENCPDFQFEILGGMGNDITLHTRTAQPAARSLAPFITWLRTTRQQP